uniref:Kazal-like domain-containing protein n=1 Tax=Timema tahoe TaxID=61484 RepID=A0A7R9IN32_9NEOP|nr:unnamed protein product [Timema tahoe]
MVDGFTSLLTTLLDDSPHLVGYKEDNSSSVAGVMLEVEALSVRYKPPPKECPTTCSDIWEPVCAGEDLYTIRTFQNLCSVELQECNTKVSTMQNKRNRELAGATDFNRVRHFLIGRVLHMLNRYPMIPTICLALVIMSLKGIHQAIPAAKCVLSGEEVVTLTPKQRNTQVSNITIGCPGHKSYQVEGLFLGAATRRHSTVILCERQLERRGSPSAGYAASLGESREGHAGHMTEGWSLIGSPPDPTYGFFTLENVEHLSYASLRLPSQL